MTSGEVRSEGWLLLCYWQRLQIHISLLQVARSTFGTAWSNRFIPYKIFIRLVEKTMKEALMCSQILGCVLQFLSFVINLNKSVLTLPARSQRCYLLQE